MDDDAKTLETILCEKIHYLSHIMFYLTEADQADFGFSWQQISDNFCRFLLALPHEQPIEESHIKTFQEIVQQKREAYQLYAMNKKAMWHDLTRSNLEFPDETIPIYAQHRVNQKLERADSKCRLITGLFAGHIGYLFGEISRQRLGGHDVFIIENEQARTPNRVLDLAAVFLGDDLYLRRESFEKIFVNNWLSFFDAPQLMTHKLTSTTEGNMLYHLRSKTLALKNIKTRKDLLAQKPLWLSQAMTMTAHHEIGHKLVEQALDTDTFALSAALTNVSQSIASALGELLADWSPNGPIWRAIEEQSSASLYMYICDKWFSGSKQQGLKLQSDIFVSLLTDYIQADQTFHFEKLKEDFPYIDRLLLSELENVTKGIRKILEQSTYHINDFQLSFHALEEALKEEFVKTDGYLNPDSPDFKHAFWRQVLLLAPQTEIENYLSKKAKFFREKIIDYETSLTQLKKTGFYQEQPPLPLEEIYKIACYEMGLYKDEAEEVFLKFFDIFHNGGVDLHGAYQYAVVPPNRFFALLRFMLQKMGHLQNITAITFGEPVKDKHRVRDKEADLRFRIGRLAKFIQRENLAEISLMMVEKDYLPESLIRDLLTEQGIEQKIKKIGFTSLKHRFIFEVYAMQRADFLDGKLAYALTQMNRQIRPPAEAALLDQTLLDHLGRAYLKA